MMTIDFSHPINPENLHPETDFDIKVIQFLKEWYSEKPRVKVQTSGSTGKPKIFEIEKSRMLHSAKNTCDYLGLKKGDTALLCLPVEYISGKMMVVRAILQQLKLSTVTPSNEPLKGIKEKYTFCAMTPLQVENSISQLPFIEKLIIGGAAVAERLKKKIKGNPTQIFETYGMSETLSHIALKKLNPKEEEYFQLFNHIKISTDARNCLRIEAPDLHPEIIQTNDVVELKNHREFKFLGRTDHIINSGGAKIFPEVLESMAKKEISNEIVFIGLPDEKYGQKLVAVVEGNKSENTEQHILNLPYEKSFHKPKEVIFVQNIPRTANGKVNRLQLQTQLEKIHHNFTPIKKD